jgi:hypothetical protein
MRIYIALKGGEEYITETCVEKLEDLKRIITPLKFKLKT